MATQKRAETSAMDPVVPQHVLGIKIKKIGDSTWYGKRANEWIVHVRKYKTECDFCETGWECEVVYDGVLGDMCFIGRGTRADESIQDATNLVSAHFASVAKLLDYEIEE